MIIILLNRIFTKIQCKDSITIVFTYMSRYTKLKIQVSYLFDQFVFLYFKSTVSGLLLKTEFSMRRGCAFIQFTSMLFSTRVHFIHIPIVLHVYIPFSFFIFVF